MNKVILDAIVWLVATCDHLHGYVANCCHNNDLCVYTISLTVYCLTVETIETAVTVETAVTAVLEQ